jgi:hypothetical protein
MSEPKASSDEGGSGDKLKDQKAAENEELARFREAWRAEVQHRKQLAQGNGSAAASASQTEEEKRPLQDVHAPSLGGVTPMGYTPVRGEKHSLDESRLKVERAPLPAKVKTNFTVTQVRITVHVSYQRVDSHHSEGVRDRSVRQGGSRRRDR